MNQKRKSAHTKTPRHKENQPSAVSIQLGSKAKINSHKDTKTQRKPETKFFTLRMGHFGSMNENEIGAEVVNCAVRLHKDLGPGLLESVYEVILAKQLQTAGLKVKVQAPISIEFEGMRFSEAFRADIIVEDRVILELKSVEKITRAHRKQVLTYLKLTDLKLGFILNFGAATIREGIARIINGKIT